MLYIRLSDKLHVEGYACSMDHLHWPTLQWSRKQDGSYAAGWLTNDDVARHPDSKNFAERLAAELTILAEKDYVATRQSDREFWVQRCPMVGEDASWGFNGDSYYLGKISRVSESKRVVAVGDKNFYRRGQTGAWKSGGWSLLLGIHNERSPHF